MQIQPNGDQAVIIQFSADVSLETNIKINQFCLKLESSNLKGVVEWVPSYNSVTIYYDPSIILYQELVERISLLAQETDNDSPIDQRTIFIPVLYGGEHGPDLQKLANSKGISEEEIIALHEEPTYLIYMLGFLPGFPYLGGLNHRLSAPRLEKPRAIVPAGSVGIAHGQTGIYPIDSPGGWNIIGRTPVEIYNPAQAQKAFLFQPGDWVKFYRITESEYKEIIQDSTFQVKIVR
ncbi:5-oxoprolinase subunit PxpB [Ornithinibacillus bavariensis]|uniref:5-oxoprolinase subunit PxpB n=1 Tax=Ornithinibacillus bavariensis TaxID=545502 RepID=UPI000EE86EA5|nr:allophanate hydrolase [Ornithinibacillus sp.]